MTTTAPTTLSIWATYEAAMLAARATALALADALEAYLKKGQRDSYCRRACEAARLYEAARAAAQPYHFGAIAQVTASDVTNREPSELAEIMRWLRGTRSTGSEYHNDGIAGFYTLELRSRRHFGTPRRSLEEAAAAAEKGGWTIAA